MRKLVNATYITLDGDIQNMQDWHFPYFGPDSGAAAGKQMQEADALIMGRKTYDGMAPAWMSREGAETGADYMNAVKKYVVSTTLTDPVWPNTEVLNGDIAAQVQAIKEQEGSNILQYGFGPVTRLLLDAGLVDEVRFWLHPVLSAKATAENLLYRDGIQTHFTFNGMEPLSTGVVILSYTPKPRS